jgi:hypothetical protein
MPARPLPRRAVKALLAATIAMSFAFAVAFLHPLHTARAATTYRLPPTGKDQWFWDIGGNKLPATTGAYPAPGSANIWDTDDFDDANAMSGDEPSGPSSTVTALHASGKYSICYIEAGAQQPEPDSSSFAAADYTNGSPKTTQMKGYSSEHWYDLRGFAGFKYGGSDSVLTGAAVNIAAGLAKRIAGCAAEGQDALEPDDLDGYTNKSASGAAGGGWGLTQADSAGFEAWLATTAHADGLAIFQKNDPANSTVDEPHFDGMIIEECNYYKDPCAGSGGDATAYLKAGKPVLNAEYTDDGETTAKYCSADIAAGITGALFNADLDDKTYKPCAPAGTTTTTTTTTTSGAAAPANTKRPAITGTARQGNELTVGTGTWTGTPTRYAYAWARCHNTTCTTEKGATSATYRVGADAVGYQLQATVTAHNSAGSTSATSPLTAVVTAD